MREAFETQNTPMLKASFAALPPAEAAEIFRRVVGSGLWVPSGDDAGAQPAGEDGGSGSEFEEFEDASGEPMAATLAAAAAAAPVADDVE